MDHSPTTFLNKLPIANTSEYYILKSIWSSEEVNLNLIDFRDASNEWSGSISNEYLKASAEALDIPFDDFCAETKGALSTNGGLRSFEYAIENDEFVLRKVDTVRVIYCQVPLVRETSLLQKVFLEAMDTIDTLKIELSTKQLDYQTLDMEFKMLAQSYEKSVVEKNASEKELLQKCAALLNSKKNKIAELQELLAEGRRLAEQNRVSSNVQQGSNGDGERLTQPMPISETQRPVRSLPKRKNLVAAETAEKRIRTLEQEAEEVNKVRPGKSDDSEKALDSEDMFDAMIG
ncbi:unnamed protein product [Hermetia illucens]|uniref:XRCC4 N-terminal domain-containing protein n=1 Tax=Hermetia illucens TaxID=343691 RepID=A0A7R8YT42_HERIL|nr:uncharacterized protein LOC119650895 [Hermetia illucens]CAD7084317.1 unnamed protein product [Hermetia illucens]